MVSLSSPLWSACSENDSLWWIGCCSLLGLLPHNKQPCAIECVVTESDTSSSGTGTMCTSGSGMVCSSNGAVWAGCVGSYSVCSLCWTWSCGWKAVVLQCHLVLWLLCWLCGLASLFHSPSLVHTSDSRNLYVNAVLSLHFHKYLTVLLIVHTCSQYLFVYLMNSISKCSWTFVIKLLICTWVDMCSRQHWQERLMMMNVCKVGVAVIKQLDCGGSN